MNFSRSCISMVLVVLSSSALANGGGAAAGSGSSGSSNASHGPVAAVSGHAGTRAGGGTSPASSGVVSSGALKGAAVSHMTIGGVPTTVVTLAAHPPLTPAEREKIRKAGYVARVQNDVIYYCRSTQVTSQGWANDCFQFAGANTAAKSDNSRSRTNSPGSTDSAPSRALVAVVSPAD
jgi:hypothetical protein